jgi:hypothetical protein
LVFSTHPLSSSYSTNSLKDLDYRTWGVIGLVYLMTSIIIYRNELKGSKNKQTNKQNKQMNK